MKALSDNTESSAVNEIENSTIIRIRRWWRGVFLYFSETMAELAYKNSYKFSASPTLAEIVRAIANAGLWQHTRKAYVPGTSFDIINVRRGDS